MQKSKYQNHDFTDDVPFFYEKKKTPSESVRRVISSFEAKTFANKTKKSWSFFFKKAKKTTNNIPWPHEGFSLFQIPFEEVRKKKIPVQDLKGEIVSIAVSCCVAFDKNRLCFRLKFIVRKKKTFLTKKKKFMHHSFPFQT